MATADAHGLFWNSNEGDRKYDADSFEKWLKKFFTSGVFESDLQVTAGSGMTVNVGTGYCNLFGKVGLFESVNAVTLAPANSTYPRIDTVVIERHDTDREIYIKAVTGAYSGNNPQPTARVWNEVTGVYQLILAQIYVAAGVSSITQSDITDKRTDTTVCGYISGTVQEMDFSQFAAQFESYYEQFVASNQEDFETWFDEMKDQLSTDAAGHLQAEIDALDSAKAPTNHASANTTYGVGTDTLHGHVKLSDNVSSTADTTGGTAATPKAVKIVNDRETQTQQMIAPIQTTLTASKNYAVGEQFVYNGLLYKATAAIAQGGTITIDGNCALADSVTGQIKSFGTAQFVGGLTYVGEELSMNIFEGYSRIGMSVKTGRNVIGVLDLSKNFAIQLVTFPITSYLNNSFHFEVDIYINASTIKLQAVNIAGWTFSEVSLFGIK